jgi:hypothetical protein
MLHLPAEESHLSCPRAGIPTPPLKAIRYSAGARRPASHSAQRPNTPHYDCRRAPAPPSKSRNSSPLTDEKKEVITTTIRPLQVVNYPTPCYVMGFFKIGS